MTKRRADAPAGVSPQKLRLALARLPRHVRDATRLFRELTGFTAVATFGSAVAGRDHPDAIPPPMHPLCESRLRANPRKRGCDQEWRRHARRSARSRVPHGHICPLGLRCSCIPIYYGDRLVGVAKCVTGRKVDRRRFSIAVQVLELAIAKTCQDFCVSAQAHALAVMGEKVDRLQDLLTRQDAIRLDRPSAANASASGHGAGGGSRLVERALDYIAAHHLEPGLTLKAISRQLGVTEKHLTHAFTEIVGQRMHAYINQLRVQHACRGLLTPETSIKQVAFESGFNGLDAFRRSFHRFVGVAPGVYRTAFLRG